MFEESQIAYSQVYLKNQLTRISKYFTLQTHFNYLIKIHALDKISLWS